MFISSKNDSKNLKVGTFVIEEPELDEVDCDKACAEPDANPSFTGRPAPRVMLFMFTAGCSTTENTNILSF